MARSFRRVCAGLLVVAAATAGSAVAGPPAVAAAVGDGAVFNDPRSPAEQRKIFRHLERLIDDTATGSTIHMAMFHFDEASIAAKLISANDRGVFVRIVFDAEAEVLPDGRRPEPTRRLIEALGTDRSRGSWVHRCDVGAACIGTKGTPINHNKFFLFSNTSGVGNVVVQTSSNLNGGNATNHWNNAVTLVGNSAIYSAYLQYFSDLAAERKTNDYYRTANGGNAKAYFFPRAGTDKSTDTIYNILNENVTCEGNTRVGTEGTHRTIIRVAMWTFTRGAIAAKLRDLADQKCWVDVIYFDLDVGTLASLSGHERIKLYQTSGQFIVHSKYMLIEGTYAGKKDSKWTFTGSHNYTNAALRENDEAMVRIESDTIHDQYRENFRLMRSSVA